MTNDQIIERLRAIEALLTELREVMQKFKSGLKSLADDLTTRETDLEMLRSIGSHVRKSGLSKDEDIIRELRKGLDEPTTRETVPVHPPHSAPYLRLPDDLINKP